MKTNYLGPNKSITRWVENLFSGVEPGAFNKPINQFLFSQKKANVEYFIYGFLHVESKKNNF